MGPASAVEVVVTLLGTTLMGVTFLGTTASSADAVSVSSFQPDFLFTNSNTGDMYITAYINITYQDRNNNTHTYHSEIAKYGEGVVGSAFGQLVHVMSNSSAVHPPESACDFPLVPVRSTATIPSGPWIALIRRGDCNFETKVKHAYNSHASAVIIYNNLDSESLDKMKLGNLGNITAVFTYKKKGEEMAKLVDNGTEVAATITVGNRCTRSSNPINRTSVLFVSISFIVLMVISLAWLVFYYVQRFRYIHAKDRLSRRLCTAAKKALSKIPTKNIRADDKEVIGDGECCPVCIDPYKVLDVVRILPCWHEFHKSCIDPWLLDHRTCPMCKMDILRYYGFALTGSQESILQFHADEVASLSLPQNRQSSLHVALVLRKFGVRKSTENQQTRSISLPPENARPAEQPTSSVSASDNTSSRECPA